MKITSNNSTQLLVHSGKRYHVVWSHEIQYITLQNGCAVICRCDGKKLVTAKSLGDLLELLPQHAFLILNRSVAVNARYIKTIENGNVNIVEMKNGEEFKIARRRKKELFDNLIKV